MATALCAQKTLNPDAEEFKPTAIIVKDLVPFLPHEIFHSQGHELVVYQPPHQGHELVVYQPPGVLPFSLLQPAQQLCYYQQHAPFYWFCHKDHFQPHYPQQLLSLPGKGTPQDQVFFDKDGIFNTFRVKKNGMRGENTRGQNRRPTTLPPRLRDAEKAWRPKGFFMRKPHQGTGSISSYKAPLLKEGPFFSSNRTTVMIRNIPNQFRREAFMLFIDHYCCMNHWEYDFLYLPIDFGTKNNVGYAFVNFTSGCAASEIREVLKKFKWHNFQTPMGMYSSRKICEVTWARIQGKEHLIKHFSQSKFVCDTDEYLPVVFSPPRNGSTSLTKPMTIGKLASTPAVSSPYDK